MVAAFAGIFQILVKMWGGHSLSGGPGSRGWELATASSQSGVQSSLLREGIVNLLRERRVGIKILNLARSHNPDGRTQLR